jgi:hypothetical protein
MFTNADGKAGRADKHDFNFEAIAEIIDSEGLSVIEMLLLGSDPHVLHEIRSRYQTHFSSATAAETHPSIGA